jgi:acyl homoserine lactone synthase
MITIHRGNRPTRCAQALLPMFEDRKRLFVDLLGWGVPVVESAYEVDQFDDAHCVYLVDADGADAHLGSMRLLPTTRPHILGTLFAELCDGPVPTGGHVWEITRLCLPCRLRAGRRLDVRHRLISAMVDHALAEGIGVLTGVVQASFRAQVLAMGWRCAPLGPAARIGGAEVGAFRIEIAPDTPALLAATGIYRPGMLGAPCAVAA